MADKVSTKLPEFLQTAKLKNFFDGTVEQVFSKAQNEKVTEWIGRKYGTYYNPFKDNYKIEKNNSRQNYQLETTAVLKDPANLQTIDTVFFTEALDYITHENGKTNNQNRLFGQNYYSYGPPIDYDKFLNYENYYWYPSLDSGVPTVVVAGKTEQFIVAANQTTFTLSYPIGAHDTVQVNGVATVDYQTTGLTLDFSSSSIVLNAGDNISVTYKIDPDDIVGLKNYTSPNGIAFTSGLLIEFSSASLTNSNYQDKKYFIEGIKSKNGIFFVETSSETELFLDEKFLPWDPSNTQGTSSTTEGWDSTRYDTVPAIENPDYITIARGSKDKNPWSRTNGWVHKDVITAYKDFQEEVTVFHPWDSVTSVISGWDDGYWDSTTEFQAGVFQLDVNRKGKRPILEFEKDIRLFDYGEDHVYTVDVLAVSDTVDSINGQANYRVDDIDLRDGMKILFVNTNFQTTLTEWSGDSYPWDHDIDLDGTSDVGWDITGADFDVSSSIWEVSGVGSSISLTKVSGITVQDYSKVTVKLGLANAGKEYYWTGYAWDLAQQKQGLNQAPLFALYDSSGKALDDLVQYPNSSFAGNKIFGYKVGTGAVDDVLGFSPHYSLYNSISNYEFENFLNSETALTGFKYYKQYDYKNILNDTMELDVAVNPAFTVSGNRFYINNVKQQTVIFQKNNTYRFILDDSSFSNNGYTQTYHPFLFSSVNDGTHNSGSTYSTGIKYYLDDVEVTELVFKSNSFNSAKTRYLEITPTASTPDTLYYYCHNHAGMGGKINIIDNQYTTIADKTETNYYNEWRAVEDKSNQKLIQEFETDEYSIKNNFDLDVVIANDNSVEVYVDNQLKILNTDYEIRLGKYIKFTNDLENHKHLLIKFHTNDVDTVLSRAYYEIPKNLSNNASNNDVTSYSYSNLLNHFSSGIQNQNDIVGLALGNNSYRDTEKNVSLCEHILQHNAPLLKFMTHVNNDDLDIAKAIKFSQSEYVRFKNKFLKTLEKVNRDNDINSWSGKQIVDEALKIINVNKKSTDNWAYSMMLSYGETGSRTTYPITASNKTWTQSFGSTLSFVQNATLSQQLVGAPGLEIDITYNPITDKDTKSLYVYKNDVLLLMNVDYVIDNADGTKIVFIGPGKPIIGDTVYVDYFETKQPVWIPATPAKLGIAQSYVPQTIIDSNYSSGTQRFTQGHDGSLTLKYNDYRDTALIELEKRIYNGIETKFIDPDYVPSMAYQTVIGNYFNKKDYSYEEYVQAIRNRAYDWGIQNLVEMRVNSTYDSSDWKTWNYSSVTNISDDPTPGHWRGIYKKFYGTHRPDSHPWEMLGFSIKPIWWDSTYSWVNVDKRKTLLNDIEKGIIRLGERANFVDNTYTDKNNPYRHDNFSNYVPVDLQGNIKSPKDIGLISTDPTSIEAKKDWKLGDISPAELAFMINSSYNFAFTKTLLVLKPAEFCEAMFDTLNVSTAEANPKQIYSSNSSKRTNNNVYVHRELTNTNEVVIGYGYNHYVSERLLNETKDISTLYGGRIRNVQPQLGIKQASYIDFDSLKVQSEAYSPDSLTSSIFLPETNVVSFVHQGQGLGKKAYSGVIVEKTLTGYKVHGYDAGANYFTTTVSDKNGSSAPVSVGGKPVDTPPFSTGTILSVGQYIKFEGQVYKTTKAHTTGSNFDPNNFQSVAQIPMEGGAAVTYYRNVVRNKLQNFEYGTEFDSIQDLFDFLINWGRYLEDQGWIFDTQNNRIRETYNWLYSAKEFLFWSLGDWEAGSIITLSPLANEVSFEPTSGIVANVEDQIGDSYAILDRGGFPIETANTTVIRDGRKISITVDDNTPIYFVKLFTREIEHVTIFDNVTSFGDVIYDPILALRQPRLKQTVLRTTDWLGKLEANGHLITNTGIVSNFDTSAKDIQTYLDVDTTTNNEDLNKAGLHTIGYQSRDHLDNLEIIDENQVRFYQGFIKQKGSQNAIDRLLRSDKVLDNQDISIYEYYAIKLADFGGSAINQSIEVNLGNEEIKTNPQIIQFLPKKDNVVTTDIDTDNIITIDVDDNTRWVKKPHGDQTKENLFASRSEQFEMPTAGYVHYNDVNGQAFTKTDLQNYYSNNYSSITINNGHLVWVAKDTNNDWNVYRYTPIAQQIENVTSTEPFTVTLSEATKLLTDHGDSVELVLPKPASATSSITTTYGNKILTLNLADQSVSKTFDFANIGGSGADIVVDEVFDKVAEMVILVGGSGYSVGDTVTVSGAGGSSAIGNVTTIDSNGAITNIDVVSGGSNFYAEPGDIRILTGDNDSAGLNAVVRLRGTVTNKNIEPSFGTGHTLSNLTLGSQLTANTITTTPTIVNTGQNYQVGDTIQLASPNGNLTITLGSVASTFNEVNSISATGGVDHLVGENIVIGSWSPANTLGVDYHLIGIISSVGVSGDIVTFTDASTNPAISANIKNTLTTDTISVVSSDYQSLSTGNGTATISIATSKSGQIGSVNITATKIGNQSVSTLNNLFPDTVGGTVIDSTAGTDAVLTFTESVQAKFEINGIDSANNKISIVDLNSTTSTVNDCYSISGVDLIVNTITVTNPATYGDATFGGIKNLKINSGGSGYQSPSFIVSGDNPAQANLIVSGGVITGAYVTATGSGYRKQFRGETDIEITIKDTVNANVDFSDLLLKTDSVSNVVVTINEEFDGTAPAISLGSTANTSLLFTAQSLSANSTVTTFNSNITDRSNVALRTNFTVTNGTTGNATVTVNYKKALYNISELDGSATTVTANDLSGSNYSLYTWKDVRLASRNNGVDQSNVGANLSATVNDFVSNVCSDITFVEGDKIFLDNGGDNSWYTMTMTANATVRTAYDTLASNSNVSANITIGSDYWIINSDVDYDAPTPDQTLFNSTLRKQSTQINSKLVDRSRIYNDYDGINEIDLDVFDPVKNIYPGVAIQEISYIRNTDPAIVTNTSSTANTANDLYVWGNNQVGQLWWDTSTIRYIEYENFDTEYRLKNWGSLFPGSTVDLYEWVKSTSTPDNWELDGTVKSTTEYVTETVTDKQGIATTVYYFWVKNRTVTPEKEFRLLPALSVGRLLKNPTSQGLSWFAPVSASSILVSNVARFISTDNSVLRLNYKIKDNDNPIHKQWILLKENDPNELVPDTVWNKFTDSLSGIDAIGNAVPDTNLHENIRYGNSIRPRQSWFKNNSEARRVFRYKTNEILANINLDIEYPNWDSTVTTSNLYDKIDYFIPGYDNTIIINRVVDTASDIDTSVLKKNEVIKVNIDNNSKWAIYIYGDRESILAGNIAVASTTDLDTAGTGTTDYNSPSTGTTIGYTSAGTQSYHSANATIQLDDQGIDPATYELVRIANQTSTVALNTDFYNSTTGATEIRQLMNVLYNTVLAGSYKQSLSELLFECINYIFTEQTNIDWIIKTSYFDVLQNDNSLQQRVSYRPDTFQFVESYVNEVKPYHGKLLNFLSKKSTAIEEANVDMDEQSITLKTDLVFDRITKSIEILSSGTQAEQLEALKTRTSLTTVPDSSAIERVAKYYFGEQLTSLITSNADSVDAYLKQVNNIIAPFKDLELNGTPFTIDELGNTVGIDKHRYDNDIGWDSDVVQTIYRSLFQSKNGWVAGTNYTTTVTTNASGQITSNSYVRYNDLSHFSAWNVANTYAVGDLVLHNSQLYRCNVNHKNLSSETVLQNSRWDLVEDYVYFAQNDHVASSSFATDYDAGNWSLVTVQFDGAGFVRPQHEDYPEEMVPAKVKETLSLTVITYEETSPDYADIDQDGNTTETHGYGDQYAFNIFYGQDGRTTYMRLPKATETTLSAEINSNSNTITVANASVLWDDIDITDPDDSSIVIGTVNKIAGGTVNVNNPSRIWVGSELIEFTGISGNTLTGIRRGVLGTPIQDHANSTVVRSASSQHIIPDASTSARWSAYDPAGTELIDKTVQATWDATAWDSVGSFWDVATLDPTDQAIFIRAGGISNFNLYNTTYVEPGYTTPQSGLTGYFSEE